MPLLTSSARAFRDETSLWWDFLARCDADGIGSLAQIVVKPLFDHSSARVSSLQGRRDDHANEIEHVVSLRVECAVP
jgi:hypothetical protein